MTSKTNSDGCEDSSSSNASVGVLPDNERALIVYLSVYISVDIINVLDLVLPALDIDSIDSFWAFTSLPCAQDAGGEKPCIDTKDV